MAVRAKRPRLFQPLHWVYAGPYNEKSLCLLSTLYIYFVICQYFQRKLSSATFRLTLLFKALEFNDIKLKPLRTVRPIYRTGVALLSRCCILYIFFSKYKYRVF